MDRSSRERLGRDLARAAKRCRDELGWVIVPVGANKRPCIPWKGRIDDTYVDDLLANGQAAGIAVACGARSGGLVARDFDRPGGLELWESRHPALARELPASVSGSRRGHHLFAIAREPTRTRFVPEERYGDLKGELRGDGALAILPPSWHAGGGRPYEWLRRPFGGKLPTIDSGEVLLPEGLAGREDRANPDSSRIWLLDPSQESRRILATTAPDALPPDAPPTARWVRDCALATRPGGPGERNHSLWSFARLLRARFPRDTPAATRGELFDEWYRLARPRIRTGGYAYNLAEFERAWHAVKAPHGVALEALAGQAAADPWVCIGRDSPAARRLFKGRRFATHRWENANAAARAFRAVARLWGWGRFPLGCRELGRVAGLKKDAAAAAARDLAAAGVVALAAPGRHDDEVRANSEWIYHGPRD